MQAAYETFRQDGRLPATYEVVFAHAWTPGTDTRRSTREDATVSLDDIKQQLRARRRP
jgi:malonyl-CoA O-methyltransferase